MKKSELILTFIQVPLDFIALVAAGLTAHTLRFSEFFVALRAPQFSFNQDFYLSLVAWAAAAWLALLAITGLYTINVNRKLAEDLTRIIYACTTGLALITIYIFFKGEFFNSRFIVLAAWALAVVFVFATHILMRALKAALFSSGIGLRNTVIIGANGSAQGMVDFLKKKKFLGYNVAGFFQKFDTETARKMDSLRVDEVLLASPGASDEEALAMLDWCNDHGATFKYTADLFATFSTNNAVYSIAGLPVIEIRRTRLEGWWRIVKSIMDFFGAIVFIILLSPFMILTAFAIFIETGMPIIYKNGRVGKNGKRFSLFKFRSMHKKFSIGAGFGNEDEQKKALEFEQELIKNQSTKEGPVYKIKSDPRITKVGKFIRRWSLDEFPQFFNVLLGNISLVGPRPHQPREVEKYEKHHKAVLGIKPGITGMAQISGRSDLEFEEEVRLDTLYMERWSLFLDFIILLKTPFILFKKRKAL